MTKAMLERTPDLDFLFYTNDLTGAGGLLYALEMGLDVGDTLGLAGLATPGAAQQPFAAAATVNGQAITNFQVQQRARFFGLLRAPNADAQGATDVLIDEALQVQAARAAGIELTAEDLCLLYTSDAADE